MNSSAILADPPQGQLVILQQKLVGRWLGQGGCDGKLCFQADGTYRLTEYGPGAVSSAGKWKVDWSELPPTLVLICTKSEVVEEIGTDLKIAVLKLNDKTFKLGYADLNGAPSGEYIREKK